MPFGGFGSENVGSVVPWDPVKSKELFSDLASDRPVPASVLSGSAPAATS